GLGKSSGNGVLATAYEFSLEAGAAPDEVALVLRLNGTAKVFSTDIHFSFDPNRLTPLGMETTNLSNAMSAQSRLGSRTISVALAGTEAVSSEGDLVRIIFRTNQQFRDLSEASISFTKFMLNEAQLLTGVETSAQIPTVFGLDQNYPNPFNPTTMIRFQLPTAGSVTIAIYDMLGREIRQLVNGDQPAGYYSIVWDGKTASGSPASSGVYFYRISAKSDRGDFAMVKRMLLVR
ncbi:MAG: FlgD immunoglobulin-like domain containing protein, partial [Bacteroidota bacterium]